MVVVKEPHPIDMTVKTSMKIGVKIKKALLITIILSSLFISDGSFCEEIIIQLEIAKESQVINKMVYGFNQNFIYRQYSSSEIFSSEIFKKLRPYVLRFPGGSISSYYNWENDHLSNEWIENTKNEYLIDLIEEFSKKKKTVGFSQYIKFYNRQKIVPVFVLNVFNNGNLYEGIIEKLKYAESKGTIVKYCEIGNELYFTYYKNKDFYEEYKKNANLLINRLRKEFKNIKIGVPIGGYRSWKIAKGWDSLLSTNEINFDAVVFHPYAILKKDNENYLKSDEYRYLTKTFSTSMKYIKEKFPGKKIWITEWNIYDKPKFEKNKTLIGVLYAADFFLKLLRDENIEIGCYHRLFGGTHSILEFNSNNNYIITKKEYPYFFWKYMGEAIKNTNYTRRLISIRNKEKFDGQIFYGVGIKYIIMINRSNQEMIIENDFGTVVNVYSIFSERGALKKNSENLYAKGKYSWDNKLVPQSITIVMIKKSI